MQEENPKTEMRGRELPGGGAVVAVDNDCVVVAGSVSNDGEKGPKRCYSVYLLPCLSSVFRLSSLLSFRSLALCFFLLWPEWLTLACSQVSQDRLHVRFIQFDKETRRQMPWEGGHPTSLAGEEDE